MANQNQKSTKLLLCVGVFFVLCMVSGCGGRRTFIVGQRVTTVAAEPFKAKIYAPDENGKLQYAGESMFPAGTLLRTEKKPEDTLRQLDINRGKTNDRQ